MAREELNQLLDPLFSFAQREITAHGEFYPFGARLSESGEISLVAASGAEDHPESQPLIDALIEGFRAEAAAGGLKAVGICADVRVTTPGSSGKTDAVCAMLEHMDGEAVIVYLPYKKRLLGRYAFGEVFATPGERRTFAS